MSLIKVIRRKRLKMLKKNSRGKTAMVILEKDNFQAFSDWLIPMLSLDPATRATPEQCLKHPFLADV